MTRRHGAAMAREIERFAGVDEVFDEWLATGTDARRAHAARNGSAVQQVPRPARAELGGRPVPLSQQRREPIGVYRQAHPI